jgi:uncharacterized cofD-like protein
MRYLPYARNHKRLVVIGGGTGSFTLLQGLKELTPNITSLVNMVDDGGSTGVLRDELGVLPPGDVRQCLVALSRSEKIRDLFNYRFEEGTLKGHSFGNIFLTALEKQSGNFAEAVKTASEVLNIQGRVVPVTLDNVHLVLDGANGDKVYGERNIDIMRFGDSGQRPTLHLEPHATANPEALSAIKNAHYIVIAPGDLYTSIGPLLIVDGVGEALKTTWARIIYVCNLVSKPGQTQGFTVSDHAAEIERFAGGPILDYVLYNTAQPPADLLKRYAKDEEFLVAYDKAVLRKASYRAIGGTFIGRTGGLRLAHDPLAAHRSLIRHDVPAITRALKYLMYSHIILTKYK